MDFYKDLAGKIKERTDNLRRHINDVEDPVVDWRARAFMNLQIDILDMIANDIAAGPQEPKCTCLPGSQFVKNSAEDLAAIAMCPIHNPYKKDD
jgi:hypothetical protein